jgi:hypothetical protein
MNPEYMRACAVGWRNFATAARIARQTMIDGGIPDLLAPSMIADLADTCAEQLEERARVLEGTVPACAAF